MKRAPPFPPAQAALSYRVREGHVLSVDDATSERMRGVRRRGTKPELIVRRALAHLGHRYRLDNQDLAGSPDFANRSSRWAVFVHGCFWHRHGCKATTTPTRNREFWLAKFSRNMERDRRAAASLSEQGYRVITIWECSTKAGAAAVEGELARALTPPPARTARTAQSRRRRSD